MDTTRWLALAVGTTAAVGALTATALAFEADDDTTRIRVDPIAWSWDDPGRYDGSWLDDLEVRIDADVDAVLGSTRARGVRQVVGRMTAISVDDDATSIVIDGTTYDVAESATPWLDDAWAGWVSPSVDQQTRPVRVRATLDADGEVVRLRRA